MIQAGLRLVKKENWKRMSAYDSFIFEIINLFMYETNTKNTFFIELVQQWKIRWNIWKPLNDEWTEDPTDELSWRIGTKKINAKFPKYNKTYFLKDR